MGLDSPGSEMLGKERIRRDQAVQRESEGERERESEGENERSE